MSAQTTREFGSGPLYRMAQAVYTVLGPTVCFLVVCLPFAVAVTVAPSAPVIAVAGILIGPAWTALLYATRVVQADRDRGPVASFWRGYRLNWRQTLAVWAPYWVLLIVAGADVVSPVAPLAMRWVVGIIAAASTLWMSAVLLIISRYSFRTRDVLRLGGYVLVGAPRSTVTDLALLVLAGATIFYTSEFVLGLLAGLFALFAVIGAKGAFELLDARFTTQGRQDGPR
jgi:uncharacterized membrane protein YesL